MKAKLKNIANLGLSGLNSDVAPWELPESFITYGNNFRVFAGSLRNSGGYANWSTSPDMFHPGFGMHVGSTSGDYWIIAGRDAVKSFDGELWEDISSTEGYAGLGTDDELDWTGCQIGQIPLINNPQAQPEYWSPQSPAQELQPLPWDAAQDWATATKSCHVLRAHKQFLFALHMTEAGEEQPDAYRWSHPADINGLPYTWDETDPASLAGRAALGGAGGKIIDGYSLRDSFVIYSEAAINVLDSDPTGEFVWRRRELSTTVGLLAKNCVVEVKGKHFFLSDGDILVNDGTSITSIVHNRIRRRLTSQISADYYHRSYAVRNNAIKEIWFCVPEGSAQYPNVAYIYNWQDDTWAIRDLPYEDTEDDQGDVTVQLAQSYAAYGPQSSPVESWADWAGTWQSGSGVWGSRSRSPLEDTIVGIFGIPSELKILDATDTTDSGGANFVIERTDYPLDGLRSVTTITRLYPHIEGSQKVKIKLGSQDYPGSAIRWKPAVEFDPTKQRKVDIRTTGELHCWNVSSTGTGSCILSGMDIEYTVNGTR